MLTRIEISGFKTFDEFTLDLNPFTVVAGANAAGKSNLFDSIRLLSRLAEGDLRAAFTGLRGEPQELFRRRRDGEYGERIDLAVEVLLDPTVRDPWGQQQELTHTRFRYELGIIRRAEPKSGLERLYVVHEAATPLRAGNESWPRARKANPKFAKHFMRYRRVSPLLETESGVAQPSFHIRQDGTQGRQRPAQAAEATVLSSITTAEFKHLYALRQELRSWRFLQLDPAALRAPAPQQAPDRLEPDGGNLAAVMARIRAETADEETGDVQGSLADISADLASVIPGVMGVSVDEDKHNKQWDLSIVGRGGKDHSARVASDGTLRMLALLTVLNDPLQGGLMCFEEPENGVHPARLRPLLDRLRSLVSDPWSGEEDPTLPLTQLIMTTHSPVVVAALQDDEGVFFESASVAGGDDEGAGGVRTRQRIVRKNVQQAIDPNEVGTMVTAGEVAEYLATARGV